MLWVVFFLNNSLILQWLKGNGTLDLPITYNTNLFSAVCTQIYNNSNMTACYGAERIASWTLSKIIVYTESGVGFIITIGI